MDIDRLMELARRRIQTGQNDGAIDALRQVLAFEPDLSEAHAYLALCLLNAKRLHAALQEARIALSLESDSELAHYALANIYIAQRDFINAQEHAGHLMEMDPNHPPYYLLQASLNRLRRKMNEILPLLEKALELDPESPRVLAELSDYYVDRGELGKAERYAHDSLSRDPENVNGLVAMGNVLLRQGKTEESREHAVLALQHAPDNVAALALLAGIKARKNPALGLWWRYNVWMNSVGGTRSIAVLLLAYIIYRIATMGLQDMEMPEVASLVQYLWMAIVVYTFIGPSLFTKSLRKEMSDVRLKKEF